MTYRLRTLGGLALAGSSADETFSGSRRKPLALLALLAVAGSRGMTRDKLAAYLWPEGESDKVRGVLKQTIYTLRQAFGDQEVIQGAGDLRLNPGLIAVDLWEFERAVDSGDAALATSLYEGPFLDGFHLSDATGFEQWVDAQRDRLSRKFASQIEILALSAMGRNQPRAAADWWLKLTEHDPLDVRAVSGLLHACLQDGDRPKAIKYAERHMALLRKELEITPDPEIRRLVDQARARPQA